MEHTSSTPQKIVPSHLSFCHSRVQYGVAPSLFPPSHPPPTSTPLLLSLVFPSLLQVAIWCLASPRFMNEPITPKLVRLEDMSHDLFIPTTSCIFTIGYNCTFWEDLSHRYHVAERRSISCFFLPCRVLPASFSHPAVRNIHIVQTAQTALYCQHRIPNL